MNVLTLSLWENFWWGLIYFDQFKYSRLEQMEAEEYSEQKTDKENT